jgi:WhiB family transcriptional regulator, redox-sensing transcriptional regulator
MSAARPGEPAVRSRRPAGPKLPVLTAGLALPDLPRAVCKGDPAPWEPGPGHQTGQDAKQACAGCPERAPCLAWALDKREQEGIWGGTTPDERKAILGRHREASGAVA